MTSGSGKGNTYRRAVQIHPGELPDLSRDNAIFVVMGNDQTVLPASPQMFKGASSPLTVQRFAIRQITISQDIIKHGIIVKLVNCEL